MSKKKKISPRFVATAGIIAALYCVATMISTLCGLSSGVIQLRLSEAFAVLAAFTPAAIPGLATGCLVSNIISGCSPLDIVFGTLATLVGAVGAWALAGVLKREGIVSGILSTLPNFIANTMTVPLIIKSVYGAKEALPFIFLTVGVGELISGVVLGTLLYIVILPRKKQLFRE